MLSFWGKKATMTARKEELDHLVTLLVSSTGLFAEIDLGSALAIVSVYKSEHLWNLDETIKPVLVKDPCKNELAMNDEEEEK